MKQLPRGLRNNNPGNIRNSDATDWQGEVPASKKQDNTFEEFEDMAHGYRALIKLLQNYRRKYGCQTIADFISRWAPRTEITRPDTFLAYARKCRYRLPTFRM